MAVRKNQRHKSKSEPLEKSRKLIHQLMIITRPEIQNEDGSKIKAGILGKGQAFYTFGNDIFHCGKEIHSKCYQANEIYLKDKDTLKTRTDLHKKAISYCDSILRLLDLCIYSYDSKKNRKSFFYVARLVKDVKSSIQDRMNRDKLIIEQKESRVHK